MLLDSKVRDGLAETHKVRMVVILAGFVAVIVPDSLSLIIPIAKRVASILGVCNPRAEGYPVPSALDGFADWRKQLSQDGAGSTMRLVCLQSMRYTALLGGAEEVCCRLNYKRPVLAK
jgi:hypothetical protein